MKKNKICLLALSAFFACFAAAEINMPKIFSENMVLQRQKPVNVWGTAEPNANVEVTFDGRKKSTRANSNGEWLVALDPMEAKKIGADLKVFENGKEAKNFANVVVGEVWLSGGQSNMQFAVNGLEKKDLENIRTRANYPLIREIAMEAYSGAPTPQKDLPENYSKLEKEMETQGKISTKRAECRASVWKQTNAEVVGNYSALAFLFAEGLHKDLDVPIGIIGTALGGTSMITWVPQSYISKYEGWQKEYANFKKLSDGYNFKDALKQWQQIDYPKWEKDIAQWKKTKKGKEPRRPYKPTFNSPARYQSSPTYLYNAKIAPIANFTIRGAIWYQGENDGTNNFDIKLSNMIAAWRDTFKNPSMPFIVVQMPSFGANWASKCWYQFKVFKNMQNVGLANAIDTGVENDIHPKDKLPIARRLQQIAMRDVYGAKNLYPYGPMLKSVSYKGESAEVHFDTDGRGLVGKGEARGFEVKIGANKWVEARTKIDGEKVVVSSPDNVKISGVRYLWGTFPKPRVWLYNTDGEPAFLFVDEK